MSNNDKPAVRVIGHCKACAKGRLLDKQTGLCAYCEKHPPKKA